MSGHSSFYTPETKKQAPIFTQTNRMDEQNQQTTPPAITYDPLWGFKEKKQDRPITLVEQDGANCGCFAAGMAVASLIRAPWNVSKSTLDDAPEKYAVAVAKGIEGIAIRDGLSAVGEMFDANSLVTAINTVLQAKECLPSEKAGKYMAKVAQFYTPEQLAELLTRASAMGVRVLIPYYSQNEAPAVMPDETKVPAEEMYCAHWGVMSRYPIGSSRGPLSNSTASTSQLEPDSLVHLYEGHETAIGSRCTIDQVARSNHCLGDAMDWNSYLNTLSRIKRSKAITALQKRTQGNPASFTEATDVRWLNSDNDYNPNQHLFETVNLRGQVILIGKKADASAQASQTAPAGGSK